MKDLAKPTIHMGGSPAGTLLDNYKETLSYLRMVQEKLGEGMPHGRDYYVQEAPVYNLAREQQEERIRTIRQMIEEIEFLAEDVLDQHYARGGKR